MSTVNSCQVSENLQFIKRQNIWLSVLPMSVLHEKQDQSKENSSLTFKFKSFSTKVLLIYLLIVQLIVVLIYLLQFQESESWNTSPVKTGWELEFFSLEKRMSWGDVLETFRYLKQGPRKKLDRDFLQGHTVNKGEWLQTEIE